MNAMRSGKRRYRLIKPVAFLILSAFFDKKYLQGRHFGRGLGGFVWGFRAIWARNILRLAPPRPWPVALSCTISNPENVIFHPDDLNNFQSPGVYMQNFDACIRLGRGSYVAPNMGLITSNHRLDDLNMHEPGKDIEIGDGCWLGMNSVILPGVILGPQTIVAANSVVNCSFTEGRVLIGGAPARILRKLDRTS